jgi:hypothetical protein
MQPKDVPDWRIYFTAQVGEINGQPVPPGYMVVHMPKMDLPRIGKVSFPPASPYRLALHMAIRANQEARTIWARVKFDEAADEGTRTISFPTLPALYDYFERCMVAATFSYQALETYANGIVEERLGDGQTFELQRKKGPELHDATGVQRWASTPEKLTTVLPALLGIALDKGGQLWQAFQALDQVRDAIMHLKTANSFRAASDSENGFYQLLKADPTTHPRTALRVMRHFTRGGDLSWLAHAEEQLVLQRDFTPPSASVPLGGLLRV